MATAHCSTCGKPAKVVRGKYVDHNRTRNKKTDRCPGSGRVVPA